MKNMIALAAVSGLAMAASADIHTGLTYAGQATIGDVPSPIAGAAAETTRYSNVDNFALSGFSHGADTAWDDLTLAAGPGQIANFDFSIANFGGAALSSVDIVVSFSDDAALDGPDAGDNRIDINFGTVDLNAILGGGGLGSLGVVTLNSGDLTGLGISLPEGPAGFTWMGVTFTNAVGVANADVGQGIFDPPTVGASGDVFFLDSFGLAGFGGDPVANFGNALATVPAPGAFALFGLGGLVASRRRR